jgi:serine/threonine protein kinase
LDTKFYFEVAHELIDALQSLHAVGRTYNDLKPENVMFEGSKVRLVDFGLADRFIDSKGYHISEKEGVDAFQGNLMFATEH